MPLREVRLELSFVLFSLGLFMLIEAVTQSFLSGASPAALKDLHRLVGAWNIWMWFGGVVLSLGAGYYMYDSMAKRREFRHLINTTSKQKFLRSRDRLEVLLGYLPKAYELTMIKKMDELGVK